MSFLETLLDHRRWVVALWLVLVAALVPGLGRLGVDNSPEVFFVRDAERLERYRRFQMDFGRDRAVRLVVSGPGLWTREGLGFLDRLEQEAAKLPGVFGTAGLAGHYRHRFESWPPDDPAALRRAALDDPLDREAGFVAGDSGEIATVLVALYNLPPERQNRLLDQLESLVAEAPASLDTSLAGLPLVQRAMDREAVTFSARFYPWLGLLTLALLTVALRRPAAILLPWVPTAVCLVVIFGLRGLLRQPLNLVEIVLVPLLFVIALATAVHVQMRFRDRGREGRSPIETVLVTYREKGWPVLWTGLTTMAGFSSLSVSLVPPVRALGLWTAGGLALITLVLFTLYPAVLATGGGSDRARRSTASGPLAYDAWAARLGRAWATWAVRPDRRRGLGVAFLALAVVALIGLGQLRRDTGVLGYLAPSHPVRADLERLQSHGVGAVAAELVLRAGAGEAPFVEPEGLDALARLAGELRREPQVLSVVGAGELWRSVLKEVSSGEPSEAARRAALERVEEVPKLRELLAVLRTSSGREARLSVQVPMRGFEELEPLFTRLLERTRNAFPDDAGYGVHLTGRYPLVLAAQRRVLSTMVVSLSLTFLAIAAIFRAVLGSFRLALVALVPNLWPVLCVLGAMGWLALPLDGTTMMVASVVLGLAVDDTLHTLGRLRREAARWEGRGEEGCGSDDRQLDPAQAAVSTLEHTAPAHLLTSAVLVAGFAVCALTSFVPIARFGALTAMALGLALMADLLLVPALLAALPPRVVAGFRPRSASRRG